MKISYDYLLFEDILNYYLLESLIHFISFYKIFLFLHSNFHILLLYLIPFYNKSIFLFSLFNVETENKPQYPFIYTSVNFRDYLIYSNKGEIFIRSLPYLEVFKSINLNPKQNLTVNCLYLQFYQSQKESEKK